MDLSEGVSNQEFVRMHTLIYKLCTIPQVAALPARRAAAALPMADALRCEHVRPWGRCVGVHAHAYVRSATSLCWLLCDSAVHADADADADADAHAHARAHTQTPGAQPKAGHVYFRLQQLLVRICAKIAKELLNCVNILDLYVTRWNNFSMGMVCVDKNFDCLNHIYIDIQIDTYIHILIDIDIYR
jgi:hypothetical protein